MSAHGSFIRVIFLPCILLILRGGGVFLSLHELWLRHLRGEHVQGGGVAVQAADFVAENADRLTLYSYPTLYAGWIFEMFEYLDIHIIVYDLAHYLEREFPADLIASDEYYWVEDFNRCMVRLVDDMQPILSMEWCQPMWDLYKITFGLPTKNLVHMTIQEAPLCTNVCMLPSLRKLFGNTTPQVILHFNHERPWSQENIACDISELRTAYSSASLVLRNYYYADLDDAALYFPLGTGKLSFEKAIPSNGFTQGFPHRHSSERFLRCAFLGRMRYEDAVDSSGSQFQSGGDPPPLPPQEAERAMLMSTLQRLGCYYLGFDDVSRAVNMGTYASVLNSAVFAPCPGGNNPETFRHYEALELGAIPVMVQINNSQINFVKKWVGYPGPVFRSWPEAEQYMALEHSPGYLNSLQKRLIIWYQKFKDEYKRSIARTVTHALTRPQGGTDYAAENERIRNSLAKEE